MINTPTPETKIVKNVVPAIYLDTNVLIELSNYEKGCCKNEHVEKIGVLYTALRNLMKDNRILCVLGNQFEEMAVAPARKDARRFLFGFTNAELKSPPQIKNAQVKAGYRAFATDMQIYTFEATEIVKKAKFVSGSSIEVHAIPAYSPEQIKELKQDKYILAEKLNEAKIKKRIAKNYDEQLKLELQADFNVFKYRLEHSAESQEDFTNMLDALAVMYSCIGLNPRNASHSDIVSAVDSYNQFLLSSYHHKLPYVWISSVLFAHIMQRQKKISQSDNLDITWASAYLPFVDYAVTDTSFCDLLNQSGLSTHYGTKVFCFKTINNLLEKL